MGLGDNHVYLMDFETCVMIHVFSGHTSYVHSVDTCDNKLLPEIKTCLSRDDSS